MKITHIEHVVHSGAETVTDQLAGTIVENVPTGGRRRPKVSIAVVNNTALTAKWSARANDVEIARDSFCPFSADGATPKSAVFHTKEVEGGSKLNLELVAAAASTSCVIVVIDA